MKILIITQAVDCRSDVLGFFVSWISEFAKKASSVTVIALSVGDFSFPENVRVMSLGKEEGKSRLKYVYRFLKYIIRERKNYDRVFVHMNQEYVLIGGLFWKLFGIPVYLWRNHAKGNILTNIAVLLSKKVFATSSDSYVASFKKTQLMPVGIDLSLFQNSNNDNVSENRMLMLGRISRVKNVHILIEALKIIKDRGQTVPVDIIGNYSSKDREYFDEIVTNIKKYNLENVRIMPGVNYSDVPKTLRNYKCLINLTPSGSLDKTIFEALASNLSVIVSNSYFYKKLPENWIIKNDSNVEELADKIIYMNNNLDTEFQKNSETISKILQDNSLESLTKGLFSAFL